jgi:hypothetical protein
VSDITVTLKVVYFEKSRSALIGGSSSRAPGIIASQKLVGGNQVSRELIRVGAKRIPPRSSNMKKRLANKEKPTTLQSRVENSG